MIWRRLLGAALIVIGAVALVHGLAGSSWMRWNMNAFEWADRLGWAGETFELQRTIEVRETSRISIVTNGANIELTESGTDRIRVRAHGTIDAKDKERISLVVEPDGTALRLGLDMPRRFPFGIGMRRATLTVELPPGQWEQIAVTARSGNVTIDGVSAAELAADIGSGNLTARNVDAARLRHHAGSGNATMTGIRAEQVELSLGSGNLNVREYFAERIVFHGGSGNAAFIDGSGSLDGELASGNFRLQAGELDRDVQLRTGSGNVRVKLTQPPDALTVDFDSGSGRGTIEWDGFMHDEERHRSRNRVRGAFGMDARSGDEGEDGGVTLTVRTGSGNFTLER